MRFDEPKVRKALPLAWSSETAVQWTAENPALGQCNVTAAVVFDLYGGEILRTKLGEFWHYYNGIEGVRYDLTDSQFTAPGAPFNAPEVYDDEAASREDAMTGVSQAEYDVLKSSLLVHLEG